MKCLPRLSYSRGEIQLKGIGRCAVVNLSTKSIDIQKTPEDLVKTCIGGRGMNMAHLEQHLKLPGTDALSPDNVLIFGNGLLTGLPAPSASRMNVTALSPETGLVGDANMGGGFGWKMRESGFDRLILLGRSSSPVCIFLKDGRVEIVPGDKYWGLDTQQTQKTIRQDWGQGVEVACIGPAGENLVRFACVITGKKNAAGRCGMGSVMGSKNVKAVIAGGGAPVEVADRAEMIRLRKELSQRIGSSKVIGVLQKYGTPFLYDNINRIGSIRAYNGQKSSFSSTLNAGEFYKLYTGRSACTGCSVGCRHANNQGGEGPEFSAVGLLGSNLGIDDPQAVTSLNNMANDLGLDVSGLGGTIGWALELWQRGLMKDRSIPGFGQFQEIARLVRNIASRTGVGDFLAEGSKGSGFLEEENKKYLLTIKGLHQSDPVDLRFTKGFALGNMVSSRGSDHLRGRPTLDVLGLPENIIIDIYGAKSDGPAGYNGKAHAVVFSENIYALGDCLGICRFVTLGWNSPKLLGLEDFSRLVEAATGWNPGIDTLFKVGDGVVNMERRLNMSCGLTKQYDMIPDRYLYEPIPDGPAAGQKVDRQRLEGILDEYYVLRGWMDV